MPIEMKRVETTTDRSRGTLTYQLDHGRSRSMVGVTFNGWVKRIPVMQNGRRVGTLPTDAGPFDTL